MKDQKSRLVLWLISWVLLVVGVLVWSNWTSFVIKLPTSLQPKSLYESIPQETNTSEKIELLNIDILKLKLHLIADKANVNVPEIVARPVKNLFKGSSPTQRLSRYIVWQDLKPELAVDFEPALESALSKEQNESALNVMNILKCYYKTKEKLNEEEIDAVQSYVGHFLTQLVMHYRFDDASTGQRAEFLSPFEWFFTYVFVAFSLYFVFFLFGVRALKRSITDAKANGLRHESLQLSPKIKPILFLSFGLWYALFPVIALVFALTADQIAPGYRLAFAGGAFVVSQAVLLLPLWFGVSFKELKTALGWTAPGGVAYQVKQGIVGWMILQPIFFVGCAFEMIRMYESYQAMGIDLFGGLLHISLVVATVQPIIALAMTSKHSIAYQLFPLGMVAAPFGEETAFRGALLTSMYPKKVSGHLFWRLLRICMVISVFVLVSFVFVRAHHAMLGWPILFALSFGFIWIRLKTGSLIAPMIMHGLHNGVTFCLAMFLF